MSRPTPPRRTRALRAWLHLIVGLQVATLLLLGAAAGVALALWSGS